MEREAYTQNNIVSRVLSIAIALCMLLPMGAIISGNAVAESNNNFEVYGIVYMPDHVIPASYAMIMVVNDIKHLNCTTYADENGVYSLSIEADEGDLMIVGATDYFRTTKTNFLAEGISKQLDLALEHTIPSSPPPPPNLPEEEEYPEIPPPEPPVVEVTPVPNLAVSEIEFSTDIPFEGDIVTITATIDNKGLTSIEQADVSFYVDGIDDGNLISTETAFYDGTFTAEASVNWLMSELGYHTIFVVADPGDEVEESNETDNMGMAEIEVVDVPYLAGKSIFKAEDVEAEVESVLAPTDARQVNKFIDQAIMFIQKAERDFNAARPGTAVNHLNLAVNYVWKAMEEVNRLLAAGMISNADAEALLYDMNALAGIIIDTSGAIAHTNPFEDIAKTEKTIMEIRTEAMLETGMSPRWRLVDNTLVNALQHFQMAMKALAEGKDIEDEIQQGYDKLEKAKAEVVALIQQGEITGEFGSWVIETINGAVLKFPPDLTVSRADVVITDPAFDGEPAEISVTVRNTGVVDVENVLVEAYDDGVLIGSTIITTIASGGQQTNVFDWMPIGSGAHLITVKIDPEDTIVERTEANNLIEIGKYVLRSDLPLMEIPGDWVIDEPTEISGTNIIVGGHVIVNAPLKLSDGWMRAGNIDVNAKGSFISNLPLEIASTYDSQYHVWVHAPNGEFGVFDGSTIYNHDIGTPDQFHYDFIVEGTLNVDNSTIEDTTIKGIHKYHNADNPANNYMNITTSEVKFSSGTGITCNGTEPQIRIEFSSIFDNLGNGINVINGSAPKIRYNNDAFNGGIHNNTHGIYCDATSPEIEGNNISSNRRHGIYFNGASSSIVRDNLITNHTDGGDSGIYLYDSSPIIESNEIYKNYFGIGSWSTSNPYIANNTISFDHWQGIIVGPGSVPYIYNNTFEYNVYGIDFYNSPLSLLVENNTLNYNQYGMWLSHASPSIENNILDDNSDIGIWLYNDNCDTVIKNNEIHHSSYGVYANGESTFKMSYDNMTGYTAAILLNNKAHLDLDNSNLTEGINGLELIANSTANVINNSFLFNQGVERIPETGHVRWFGYGVRAYNSHINLTGNILMQGSSVYFQNTSGIICNNLFILPYWSLPEGITPAGGTGITTSQSCNVSIQDNILFGGGGFWSSNGINILRSCNTSLINNTVAATGIYEYDFRGKTYTMTRLDGDLIIEEDGVEIIRDWQGGWLETPLTIIESTVVANDNYFNTSFNGIVTRNSHLEFRNNSILHQSESGLYIENCTGNVTGDHNISANKNGIYAFQTSMTFAGNRIENNTEYGLISIESDNNISDNWVVLNHDGLYYADNPTGQIKNNTIGGHVELYVTQFWINNDWVPILNVKGYGINMFNTSVDVIKNNLLYNGYGMFIEEASPLVESNTIDNHTYTVTLPQGSSSAGYGIYILNNSNPIIRYNNLSSNYYEIYAENTQGTIELNNITQLGMAVKGYGIEYKASTLLIQNNDINNHTTGISIRDADGSSTIQLNAITDCAFAGFTVHNAQGRISDNMIVDCITGLYLAHESSPHIEYNTITRRTTVHDGWGIYVRDFGSAPTIEYNDISYQKRGIELYDFAIPIIIYNDLHDNDYGIYFLSAEPDLFKYNDIYGNTLYGAYNAVPSRTIDAEGNWWGDEDGPNHPDNPNYPTSGDAVSDDIDFFNWSTAPNT